MADMTRGGGESPALPADQWSVLMPVKRLAIAKSRLAVDALLRAELTLAMACDTVTAVQESSLVAEVVVVSDDDRVAEALKAVGARVVADLPDAGINAALRYGASQASLTRVVALAADLPCLRADDIDEILGRAAAYDSVVVADTPGTGTTLFAASGLSAFVPSFGINSRAAHVAVGATDLTGSASMSLRHDVDTIAALRHAIGLGVGAWTALAVDDLPDFAA